MKKGDTLYEIAAKNGTTVEKLKKLNKIKGNTILSDNPEKLDVENTKRLVKLGL